MKKDDLMNKVARDAEISKNATGSELEGGCENVGGSVKQMLCKVCCTPVIGPTLPICGNYAYVGQ